MLVEKLWVHSCQAKSNCAVEFKKQNSLVLTEATFECYILLLNIKKQQHNIDWNKNEKKDEVLCDFSIQGSYTQATKYYLLELSPVRLTIQ